MHVDYLIPWPWLLLASSIVLLVLCVDSVRLTRLYKPRTCILLACLRLLAWMAVLLLLAPVSWITSTPQLDRLKTAVVVDLSRSMDTQTAGQSRRQQAEHLLNHPASRQFLNRSKRTEYYGFSHQLTTLTPDAGQRFLLSPMAGNTRLGDALQQILNLSEKGTPYATVLLLSDGRNLDGSDPIAVAKQFSSQKIPVSTIRFQGGQSLPDVRIQAQHSALTAVRNKPFSVTALLHATTATYPNLSVELLANSRVLASQHVTVSPGKDIPVTLTASLMFPGFQILTLRVSPSAPDAKPDNNVDYITVDVSAPPVFTVLYMDYGMDWEWRFLKRQLSRSRHLKTRAIIQTSKDTFSIENLPETWGKHPTYPEQPEQLADVDVIITSITCLNHLTGDQLQALRAFVEYKGGGLLIRGTETDLPDILRPLLPAKQLKQLSVTTPRSVHVRTELAYGHQDLPAFHPQGGIWLPPPGPVTVISTPRPSTRLLGTLDRRDGPSVLAVHAYGAGRVAFLGVPQTWRWALGDDAGDLLHHTLWTRLVSWLAQAGKPMVHLREHGNSMTVGDSHDLTVDILGNDFRPSPDARVTITITDPSGQTLSAQATPDPEELGTYVLPYQPQQPGEYKLQVQAAWQDRKVQRTGAFLATLDSREHDHVEANPQLLQDISRITEGRSFTPEAFLTDYANTPISKNVPLHETLRPIVPAWCAALLFTAFATAAWYLRRRLGLT